jgi:ketosteroid isomerase-like protein
VATVNVEVVRSVMADWERGDYSRGEWAAPDIEYVRADGPEPGSWTGVSEIARANRETLSAWEGYRLQIEDCRELAESRVLVLSRTLARGRRSGMEIESGNTAQVWTLREGMVTRIVTYYNRNLALDDLGLAAEYE